MLNLIEEAAEWHSLVDIDHLHYFHFGESALLGLLPDLLCQEGLLHSSISVHVYALVDFEQPLEYTTFINPLSDYGGTFYTPA